MRIKNLLSLFFLLLTLAIFARPAQASHLFGGEFTYQYIGQSGVPSEPFRYKVIYKTYVTCVGFGISPTVFMTFHQKNGTQIKSLNVSSNSINTPLPLPVPPGCTVSGLPCISLKIYETFVNLPLSFDGYYVTGTTNARNGGITNISNVGGSDLFLYMELPSPALANPGSSPVFTDTAVVVMFKGDTTSIINSAFDADGDKLIYSFNNPYGMIGSTNFNPATNPNTPSKIGYNSGFSFAQPFGAGGFASINASTGLARYYVPNIGNYVISFQVKEYRSIPGVGDVLIGSTIRDIQLVVKDPPVSTNLKPNFTYNGPQIITITEGQAITPINFTFTDPDFGNLLKITASSPLLDGAGGKNATFNSSSNSPTTINNAVSGTTATFNFSSACGQANFYPLDITVQDNACPPGKKVESFQIVVLPYEGPDKIFGDTTVCTGATEAYNVVNKSAATYAWRLSGGGTFVGPRNAANVNILWNSIGRFKLTAIETNTGSCQDSVSFFVNVAPGVNLTLSPNTAICAGGSATLSVTGGTNYSWTDGVNTFTGSTITVSPTATTTYSVTSAGVSSCTGSSSVTVTVNQIPNVSAGLNRSICAGTPTVLTATGANTYSWTDGTNTFTGNNVSVSPTVTTTYTVTGTNTATGCTKTSPVTITVNPSPLPSLAALPTSICKNAPALALDATQGTYTINGTAATSFNPATLPVGNNTVVVSKTANGCTGTATKVILVNAAPTANFGTLATSYCKNAPAVSLNIPGSTFLVDGVANNVSFDPAALSVGNHTVSVTTTNADNCSVTASMTIAVNAVPAPTLAALPTTICKNAAALPFDATQGTYTIDGVTAANFNPANLSVGPHTVVVSQTANGCTGTATKVINVNATPTANFGTLATAYCKNSPAVSLNIPGSSFTIDGVPNNVSFNPAALSVGNHTVAVTTTNADNCSVTATMTVAVNAIPTANFGPLLTAYCKNAPAVQLNTITGSTFQIDGVAATTFDPAALSVGNHTVSVITTNASNCSVTGTMTIAVNPIPAPSLAFLANSYCQNNPSVTLPTGTGISYTINGVAVPASNSVLNPATLTVGPNVVVITETNATNCTVTATRTITINAAPTANFGPLVTAYCKNAPAVPLNTITGSTFTIDGVAATSFDPAALTAGNHTVTVTTTNAANCSVTGTMTIAVNPIPAPSLAFLANSYCQNNPSVTLPTGTGISYTINGVAVPAANSVLNPATLTVGPNVVVISETNGSNCTVTATRTITIDPVPLANAIAGPTSICPGTNGVTYSIVNPGQTVYQWVISAGHGTIVSGQGTTQITVNWGAAAAANLTVRAQNAQGCLSAPTVLPVTINPILITPQPVGPLTVCKNQAGNVQYTMQNPTIGSSFTWTITGGTLVNSNTRGDVVTINWTNPGTGTIVVQESSTGSVNCFGTSAPLSVNILPSPDATLAIAGPTEVCENTSAVNFTLNGGAGSTYAWTLTQGANTTPSPVTTGTVPFNFGAPGQYTVSVTETNSALCVGTPITKVVTVTPRPVTDTIYGPAVICPDDLTEHWYSVSGPAGATYSWQVVGGTFSATTNDSIQVTFDNTTAVKQITVTPTSASGCVGTAFTRTLTFDAAGLELVAVSTAEQNDQVVELMLQMTNASINNQNIQIFRKEAGAPAFSQIGSIANGLTGYTDTNVQTSDKIYYYQLRSQNECGRPLQTITHNTIVAKAVANEAAREVVVRWNTYRGWGANGVASYEIYGKAGNGNYVLLMNVNGTDSAATLSKVASLGFNQCFRVKAIGAQGGVSWSNASCVVFENVLTIYNIITPNGDEKNENFTVENIHLYPGNELTIFNRWGTEVYTKKEYQNNWNGEGASAGTYYYLLKMADGKTYKGWFEIVR